MQKMNHKALVAPAALALAILFSTPAQSQDWDGAYAGAFLGSGFSGSTLIYGAWGGYNVRMEDFVLGTEAEIYGYDGTDVDGFVKLRLGYLPGEALLLYTTLGYGACLTCGGTNLWLGGLGAEYDIAGPSTLRLEIDKEAAIGSPLFAGPTFVKAGLSWDF